MVVVCACVAGGCRGPLFVLGPFVLAGDGLRGGALFGCFSRGFSFVGKIMVCVPFSFGLVGSGEGTFFLDNGQAVHCFWCVVVVCFVFVRFLGLSLFL